MQGMRLGAYKIDRELGSGGMGKVYAATGPDGVVALKIVHPQLLETSGFFKRFLREAQLGQSIRHENVVRTLDCDQEIEDGTPQCFLVMEYVEGQTLAALLSELERVPEELCRHVAREICKGLTAIHEAGAVHRDLKPDNVIVATRAAPLHDGVAERPRNRASGDGPPRADVEYVVKIMDLGVAQVADEALRLSRDGAFVGSVEYAAPEQFKGGDVDGRTDLHALGVLLYELSTGEHPYRGVGFHDAMQRVCESEPRRLGAVNPQLSPFFEEVVHTLLVKDPRGRFTSASQVLAVLEDGEDSSWWQERAKALREETQRPIRRIRIPRETAVYGRDEELQRLRSLYQCAKAGDGQVVLVDGEAGIGKSRLVDELIAQLQEAGEDVNFLFGSYPPGGAATASGAFSAAYREHLGDAGCAAYLPQSPVLVPAFDALLKGESAPAGEATLTRDSLQTCFTNVTRSLAAERPTVVLIDDLHFAPDEGRALFTSLAMAAPGTRLLLIGTTRPGVSEDWVAGLTRLDQTSQIGLQRLGPKDLARLLSDCFQSSELAHALGVQVGLKSDGNPFFAFEIIRGLREGQFITQNDDGTWASTRVIDEIQIPSAVLDLVNARVSNLSEQERDMLEVAACCGFEFDPGLIADVCGMAPIPALKLLGRIEKGHRLIRAVGRAYAFDHHQVQEALYLGLHETLREHYHAGIASALESRANAAERDPEELDGALCVDLCEHFLKGARGEAALRYLGAAQTHLWDGHVHDRMIELTERALQVPGLLVGVSRASALYRLAGSLNHVGRRARPEELLREAQSLTEDSDDLEFRVRLAVRLGWFLYLTARYTESEPVLRRAVELGCASGDPLLEATAMGTLSCVAEARGRHAEAEELSGRALEIYREADDRGGVMRELANLGRYSLEQGRYPEARDRMEQSLALSIELEDRLSEARGYANLGTVNLYEGRLAEAQALYEQYLECSRAIGYRKGEAGAIGNLGTICSSNGRLAEARGYHERQLVICREIGNREGQRIAIGNLALVWHHLGVLDEARHHYEQALALCREIESREGECYALFGLGSVCRGAGDFAGAQAWFEECLALSEAAGLRRQKTVTLLVLGFVRARGGDLQGGRACLVAGRDLARELGIPSRETLAECELAVLPGAEPSAALASFARHQGTLEQADLRIVHLRLFTATGDRAHLEEAKRLLDEHLAMNPPEYHESMCRNVLVNREILAAWREEFGDDDGPRGTESVTRVE